MIKLGKYSKNCANNWRFLSEEEVKELIRSNRPYGTVIYGGLMEVIDPQGRDIKITPSEHPRVHCISEFLKAGSFSYNKMIWFASLTDYYSYVKENSDNIEIRDTTGFDIIKFCDHSPLILVRNND